MLPMKSWGLRLLFALAALLVAVPAESAAPAPAAASPVPRPAVQAQTYEGLDVIFALDVSGTMYRRMNRNEATTGSAPDYGWNTLSFDEDETVKAVEPTDPNNVRFDLSFFMMDWLAELSATQTAYGRSFQVYGSIVTFGSSAETLPPDRAWNALNQSSAEEIERFAAPPPPLAQSNSSYIRLFTKLNELMDARPASSGTGKRLPVVIIVSDSLPCDISFDTGCVNFRGHLNRALEQWDPSEAHVYLYLTVPPSQRSFYDDIWSDWQRIAPTNVEYLSDIFALGPKVMEVLLKESEDVLSLAPDTEFRSIQGGAFSVPPYQESADVVVLLTQPQQDTPAFEFQAANTTVNPIDSVTLGMGGPFRRYTFTGPPAGDWQISAPPGVGFQSYALYRPARAQFTLTPEAAPSQFSPVTVTYEVLAGDVPISSPGHSMIVTAHVTSPDSPAGYDLTLLPKGSVWQAEFLPVLPGPYTVDLSAQPEASWASLLFAPQQLAPQLSRQTANVAPVVVRVTLGTAEQRATAGLIANNKTTEQNPLRITSKQSVPISVELFQDTTALPVPEGITGLLTFTGTACPEDRSFSRQPDGSLKTNLQFPNEEGQCTVSLGLALQNDLPPLNGETRAINDVNLGYQGVIDVTTTYTLEVTWENNQTRYTMHDVQWPPSLAWTTADLLDWPFEWAEDSSDIHILVLDDSGNPKEPQFLSAPVEPEAPAPAEPEASPNQLPSAPTSSPTENKSRVPVDGRAFAQASAAVPFQLVMLNSKGDDVSDRYGLSVINADAPGLYTIHLEDLDPDRYTIQIIAQPGVKLADNYQWKHELPGAQPQEAGVLLESSLEVKQNYAPLAARVIKFLLLGALLVGVVASTTSSIRIHRRPLKGQLVIYEARTDQNQPAEVWPFDLDGLKVNTYDIPLAQLPLWRPPVTKLLARTQGARDGSVYLTVHVMNHPVYRDERFIPGEVPLLPMFRDEENTAYFLVKDPDDDTPEKIIKALKSQPDSTIQTD